MTRGEQTATVLELQLSSLERKIDQLLESVDGDPDLTLASECKDDASGTQRESNTDKSTAGSTKEDAKGGHASGLH